MALQVPPYKCSLTESEITQAKEELNEIPEEREGVVAAFRDRIAAHRNITCFLESQFLLRFLRQSKFNSDKAFEKLEKYLKLRSEYPEVYDTLLPSVVRDNFESGLGVLLPKPDANNCTIVYVQAGFEVDQDKLARMRMMMMEKLFKDKENAQVHGAVFIMDMKNVGLSILKYATPYVLRRNAKLVQEGVIGRMKGFHYMNVPYFCEALFNFGKTLVPEKIGKRVHVHSSIETLHEFFTPDMLPESLGGTLDMAEIAQSFAAEMMSEEQYFKKMREFKISELEVAQDPDKSSDAIAGTAGTFRKLQID